MDSGGGLGGGDMGWLGGIGEVIAGEGIMFEGGCIAARRDIALTKGMEGCFMDGAFFFDERIMLDLEDGGGLGLDVFVEEFWNHRHHGGDVGNFHGYSGWCVPYRDTCGH